MDAYIWAGVRVLNIALRDSLNDVRPRGKLPIIMAQTAKLLKNPFWNSSSLDDALWNQVQHTWRTIYAYFHIWFQSKQVIV